MPIQIFSSRDRELRPPPTLWYVCVDAGGVEWSAWSGVEWSEVVSWSGVCMVELNCKKYIEN